MTLVSWGLLQLLNGFKGRQDEELDFATSGFTLHLIHHREGAGSGADDEPPAGPGDFFLR